MTSSCRCSLATRTAVAVDEGTSSTTPIVAMVVAKEDGEVGVEDEEAVSVVVVVAVVQAAAALEDVAVVVATALEVEAAAVAGTTTTSGMNTSSSTTGKLSASGTYSICLFLSSAVSRHENLSFNMARLILNNCSRDFDGNGAARFFLPSCLEDPWLPLLQPVSAKSLMAGSAEVPVGQPTHSMYSTTQLPHPPAGSVQQHQHHQHRHHLSHEHAPRSGRVLFQPSFLDDPWTAFVR
jgi:hypothetical protein